MVGSCGERTRRLLWTHTQEPGQRFHWHYNELDDKNFQLHGRGSILVAVIAFSVLLFLTLLCLYMRWTWRYHRRESAISLAENRSAAIASGGLDQAAIDAIPVLVVGSGDESQCSICLSNVAAGQKVKLLRGCNHGFHPECVDEWLKGQTNCPLCRACLLSASAPSAVAPV